MKIMEYIYTSEARQIYLSLKPNWSSADLDRYGYMIANYCNEMALFHRIEKELAVAPLVVEHVNNKCKTNEKKNELTRARNESQQLLLKLANALKLTPKAGGETGEEDGGIEAPQ